MGRRRSGARGFTWGAAVAVAVVTAALTAPLAGSGSAAAIPSPNSAGSAARPQQDAGLSAAADPYAPDYRHAYRHGAVPTRNRLRTMLQWARSHPAASAAGGGPAAARQRTAAGQASSTVPTDPVNLNYGGGLDGIGVTTGHEKVYLVLYGSQWGTAGKNASGYVTVSGDPSGEVPYLQRFLKGLGTDAEQWSGVMTQYCQGIAAGSQACPAGNTLHVGYPLGGALAGVWLDNSAASPALADGNQLGTAAVAAAAHFGNTTAAANRDAQYVIMSPTGTDPDGWLGQGFCAWHDYTGDSLLTGGAVTSPYGDLAFTNLPYITDQGGQCGQGFVNSPGTLDGVSITEGHEYAETVTDQNPFGGWADSKASENGDKCAWLYPGTDGGAFDLTTATGTFAMQTTWANDGNGGQGACEASHPVETNPGETSLTVTSPGAQTTALGKTVSLQVKATDSVSGQTLAYTATGLPPGLSISASGLISGYVKAAGTYTTWVSVTDSAGTPGAVSFAWTVTPPSSGIVNGGFEDGNFYGWYVGNPAETSIVSSGQHSGKFAAEVDPDTTDNNSITQVFTVPAGDGKLTFWYTEPCLSLLNAGQTTATLTDNSTGVPATVLQLDCLNPGTWQPVSVPVTAGKTYTLTLTTIPGIQGGFSQFDDVALAPAAANPVVNGGFETGTFSGWSHTASTSIVSSGQHSGSHAAQAGLSGAANDGSFSISQQFTAKTGDTNVGFWYNVTCNSIFVGTDGASATLTDNTAGTTANVLMPNCPFGSNRWAHASAPVTAGHSYTLTLTDTDSMDSVPPTWTLFDDVSAY